MRLLNIQDVSSGMVLAESIFSLDGSVELLTVGSVLSDRQISLIDRLGISSIRVYDPEDLVEKQQTEDHSDRHVETLEKEAKSVGRHLMPLHSEKS